MQKKSIEGRLITRENRSCNDPAFGIDLNYRRNHLPHLLRLLAIYGVTAVNQSAQYEISIAKEDTEKKETTKHDFLSCEIEFANYFIPILLSPESQELLVKLKYTKYFHTDEESIFTALMDYTGRVDIPTSIKTLCHNYLEGKKDLYGIKQKIEAGYRLAVLDCRKLYNEQPAADQRLYTILRRRFLQTNSGFGKIDNKAFGSAYSTLVGTGRKTDRTKIIASGNKIAQIATSLALPQSSKTFRDALCSAFGVNTYAEFQKAYTNDDIKKIGTPARHERILKRIFEEEFDLTEEIMKNFLEGLQKKLQEWGLDHELMNTGCGDIFAQCLEEGTGIKNSSETKGHILDMVTEGWMSCFTQSGQKTIEAMQIYYQSNAELELLEKEIATIAPEVVNIVEKYLVKVQAPYLTYSAYAGCEDLFEKMTSDIAQGKPVDTVLDDAKKACNNLPKCDKNLIIPLLDWISPDYSILCDLYAWLKLINKRDDKRKRIDTIRWAHVIFPYDNPRCGWYGKENCEGSISLPDDQLETLLRLLPDDKLSPFARRQEARKARNTNNHHITYSVSFMLADAEGRLGMSTFTLISRSLTSHLLEQMVLAQSVAPDANMKKLVTKTLDEVSFTPRQKTREVQWHNRGQNPFQSMYVSMVINSDEPDTSKNMPTKFFSFDINEPDVWGNVLTVSPDRGTFQIADNLYVTPEGIGQRVSMTERHSRRGNINIFEQDVNNDISVVSLRQFMRRKDLTLEEQVAKFLELFDRHFGKQHDNEYLYSGGISYYRSCFTKELYFFAQRIIDLGKKVLPVDTLASLEERSEYLLRKYNALVDERCRKLARAMLNYAAGYHANVEQKAIVLEKLTIYTSFDKTSGRNKSISRMCYRRIINYVEAGARAMGIKVLMIDPAQTSICDTPSFLQKKKVPANFFRRVNMPTRRTNWTQPQAGDRKPNVAQVRKTLLSKRKNKQTYESMMAFIKFFYGTDSVEEAAKMIAESETPVIPLYGPLFIANGLDYLRPYAQTIVIDGRQLQVVPCDGHATINIGCRGVKYAYAKQIKAKATPA